VNTHFLMWPICLVFIFFSTHFVLVQNKLGLRIPITKIEILLNKKIQCMPNTHSNIRSLDVLHEIRQEAVVNKLYPFDLEFNNNNSLQGRLTFHSHLTQNLNTIDKFLNVIQVKAQKLCEQLHRQIGTEIAAVKHELEPFKYRLIWTTKPAISAFTASDHVNLKYLHHLNTINPKQHFVTVGGIKHAEPGTLSHRETIIIIGFFFSLVILRVIVQYFQRSIPKLQAKK